MWQIKTFKLDEHDKMVKWVKRNYGKYQMIEVFVNNAWAVEYRPLVWVY